MHGKIVSVFLTISICIFSLSLISLASAQETGSIKLYDYSEGIDIAKSSGKPIAINLQTPMYLQPQGIAFAKTKAELNKFININPDGFVNELILMDKDIDGKQSREELHEGQWQNIDIIYQNQTILLILDSNGREIVRIIGRYDVGRYYGESLFGCFVWLG